MIDADFNPYSMYKNQWAPSNEYMSKPIYWVITGNHQEYVEYIRHITDIHPERLEQYEYRYVRDPSVLRGLKEIHGSFIGTWYNREDASEIYAIIRSSYSFESNATVYSMNKVKQIILEHHNK